MARCSGSIQERCIASADIALRQAKLVPARYKFADGGGLYLLVMPAGGRPSQLGYRMMSKEKLMMFGACPEVSLADARMRRDKARTKAH